MKFQPTNFTQLTNKVESLQKTMKPYVVKPDGSSVTFNKALVLFTGTYPECSVECYLNAVTASSFLVISPEPVKTPFHKNRVHRNWNQINRSINT